MTDILEGMSMPGRLEFCPLECQPGVWNLLNLQCNMFCHQHPNRHERLRSLHT